MKWKAIKHDTLIKCYTLESDEKHSDGLPKNVAILMDTTPEIAALIQAAPVLFEAAQLLIDLQNNECIRVMHLPVSYRLGILSKITEIRGLLKRL